MNRLARYLLVAALGASLTPAEVLAAAKDAMKQTPRVVAKARSAEAQRLWINGRWVKSRSKATRAIENPANLRVLGHIAEANKVDVDHAVGAAHAAYSAWSGKLAGERAEALFTIEKRLLEPETRTEIARMISMETGKPLAEAWDEVGGTAAAFNLYANLIKGQAGKVVAPEMKNTQLTSTHEPYGVVAAVVPFNFPLLLTAWKIAPALAAGNTVVIKPPHQNPLSGLLMAKLFSGLPKGVVNVVTGSGDTGKLLVAHPDVKVVAFTGSSPAGAAISAAAGAQLKKVHLELGGNDAAVVFADADLDKAARELAWSRGLNAGQVCTSPKRIIVDASVAEAFKQKLIEHVKTIRIGDPLMQGTDMGPVVNKDARDKLEQQLSSTLAEGGKLLYRAPLPAGLKGHYFAPAVVEVADGMLPSREEVFGPIYSIIVAKNEDDAFKVAKNSKWALGASAFTTSQRLVHKAKAEFKDVGMVWINSSQNTPMHLPFGGTGQSGNGSELGEEGLRSFMHPKMIHEATTEFERGDGFPYAQRTDVKGYARAKAKPAALPIDASKD